MENLAAGMRQIPYQCVIGLIMNEKDGCIHDVGIGAQNDFYRLNIIDVVLIVLIISGASWFLLFSNLGLNWHLSPAALPGKVLVFQGGDLIHQAEAGKDAEFTIAGGRMVIEIKNGAVRVKESNCPGQICVDTGFISRSGQIITCVPHQVIIDIKSSKEAFLDAVVQ